MNAVAHDTFSPVPRSKRSCYKCGRRVPIDEMSCRRTPSGGAIYTCDHCDRTRHPRKGDRR